MDEQRQERLAELVEYTRTDLARRDREIVTGDGQHIHIHHHYAAPEPVTPSAPERMDIASRYAGHFVLLLGGMIVLAGVAVVFAMIAQALMVAMISTAVCAIAAAAAVRSMRASDTDHKIIKERLKATEPRRR
jgi:hypothetical protein